MSKKKDIETVETSEVPEVLEFIAAREKLEDFKQAYPGLIDELNEVIDEYNTSLEKAEKVVRAMHVGCGPFDLYQKSYRYSPVELYEAVGKEMFLKLGGSIQTVPQYDLDKTIFEKCILTGKVHEDVVSRVRKEVDNYHKPQKIEGF